jgi:RNA polymerase sporulation-specific sigma factor
LLVYKGLNQKFNNKSEQFIVDLAKNQDHEAQEYLIRKYMPFVYDKAKKYFLIGGSKEDIIQEGLIGILKGINSYDYKKNDNFAPFVDLCIRRQILTAINKARRKKHSPLNSYVSFHKPLYNQEFSRELIDTITEKKNFDPEELVIIKENIGLIKEKIASHLSAFELKVLMKHLQGNSYSEIAIEINRNEKSVDNALQRVKQKLRKHLYI